MINGENEKCGNFQRDTMLHSVTHKKYHLSCLFKMRSRGDLVMVYKHLYVGEISDDHRSFI